MEPQYGYGKGILLVPVALGAAIAAFLGIIAWKAHQAGDPAAIIWIIAAVLVGAIGTPILVALVDVAREGLPDGLEGEEA